MSKAISYRNQYCQKCGITYLVVITTYNSEHATLTLGDTNTADARIANCCDECVKNTLQELRLK